MARNGDAGVQTVGHTSITISCYFGLEIASREHTPHPEDRKKVPGFGFKVSVIRYRVPGIGHRVSGIEFGSWVSGLWPMSES